jgi:hypothetical protein
MAWYIGIVHKKYSLKKNYIYIYIEAW